MSTILHDDIRVREKKVEEGLELIIRHLDDSTPVWALGRWISTYVRTNSGKEQRFRLVHSEQEALALYKAANYLDCRIKAYGSDNAAPSLLLVDIDREHFDTTEEFELAAAKTRANFKEILDGQPTQMWTGNGYHFLQPQFAIVLERVEMFKEFDQASRKFLHFEELKISDKKADPTHCKTVSFNNCWLRVPGSLNSNQVRFNENDEIIGIPLEAEVRVIQYWDGERPSDEQMEVEQKYRQWDKKNAISWIERLVDKPLGDHRKFCIRRVFVPYLINVKGLSRVDAYDRIKTWLDKCNIISRLNFDPKSKIDYALNSVGSYYPISRAKLEQENNPLYLRLER